MIWPNYLSINRCVSDLTELNVCQQTSPCQWWASDFSQFSVNQQTVSNRAGDLTQLNNVCQQASIPYTIMQAVMCKWFDPIECMPSLQGDKQACQWFDPNESLSTSKQTWDDSDVPMKVIWHYYLFMTCQWFDPIICPSTSNKQALVARRSCWVLEPQRKLDVHCQH